MSWDWDHLARNVSQEVYAPKRSRWTWGERGWALLILAVLAGTVALAYFTGSTK